ncbi:type II secretion system protein [Candidatus Peregrinibacteria bacterium]|nr:type II secretion system protein [Candidatus Peregrinibacteria bacterium]
MTKLFKKTTGFTLIEMLISISILMLFLGLVASSYTQLVAANRKAKNIQEIYTNVRLVFDTLASDIRTGSFDFSCIDPAALEPLCLENQTGSSQKVIGILHNESLKRSLYKFDDANKKLLVMHQMRTSTILPWSIGNFESLAPENFPLEDFSFRVFPLKDPYNSQNAVSDAVQFQPSVTVALKVGSFDFRTTYSSRTYE